MGSGRRVRKSAECNDHEWTISVRDNDTGIDPQYHDQIFDIFKRMHGRDVPGTGIGLALAKRVVQRHGGRIWVESSPGMGAAFMFTLPAADKPRSDLTEGRLAINDPA
jgi:signal transduction histidine kinase